MEKYLGVKIVSGGVKEIIDANICFKASKAHQASTQIREEVRDQRIERALQASSTMINSVIIPTLTYGTECWLDITEEQYTAMEKILAESSNATRDSLLSDRTVDRLFENVLFHEEDSP